ncbi:hypothetical protein BRADI_1g61937v3 [Brachypodium distachyon]|uniref:CID domain-containing protein n=1 Tax=Brachypodium distachyon TaxID=15368 RepID=A0A2K2DSX9_BRADI|nr:hypothetical protein BRADI_1g61937v3 [Brachypodium distachyon]
MAPARRKRGSSAAAAAAAAAAKWKLGDLVLAKMKGFPAWPAMISEPEQWGLSSVKNKRLVFFYGTKQIAFCNYAELEAFTEEKKRSLLAKRHGKGVDFVRAVDEIIDVYNSLKEDSNNKLDLVGNEVKPENLGDNNSSMDTEGLVNSPNMGRDNKLEDHSVIARVHNLVNTDEPSVMVNGSERCVVNSAPEEPTENVSILDEMRNIPLSASSFSKNKPRDTHLQNCYTRSRAPASRRSRSSLNVEARKSQDSGYDKANSASPSTLDGVWLHSSGTTFNQPGTPGASDSSKKISFTAKLDNTRGSEASQNRASMAQFKSTGASGLPMNSTVIFKRKRKPNGKWIPHSTDCITSNKDDKLPAEFSGNLAGSPNSKNDLNKSDGDEHLPLVKRARVRMGTPQLEKSAVSVEETDVSNNRSGLAAPADHCDMQGTRARPSNDFSVDQSSVVNTIPDQQSILNMPVPSGEGHSVWKSKDYQPKVLTLDVEAALPPSKRLHRALEAMSANAAEIISSLPGETGSKQSILNRCESSENSHSNKMADSAVITSDRSCLTESPRLPGLQSMHSSTRKRILQNKDVAASMKLNDPAFDVTQTISLPDRLSSSLGKSSYNDVTRPVSCNGHTEPIGCPAYHVDGSDSRCSGPVDQPLVSDNNVNSDSVPHGETVLAPAINLGDTTSTSSLATKSSSIQSDADTRTSEVHISSALALKELNHRNLKDRRTSPDSMPMKELIAVAQARRFSRSTSFSDNFLNAKYFAKGLVSTPLKDGQGHLSPPNQIIRSTSTDDSVHSSHPFDSMQMKDMKKIAGNSEASAARIAFGAFLGTLTRTKENIARATRIAIECAKHGIAREAIDIIVERMEKETNLHKRVDLFFLIDSITQCSRNQKGGAGDAYPSLIQVVLPRLLYAAAPPGNSAWENRRQCLKVLKLWLERKTLPEYIIRRHIRELEVINEASFGSSHRPSSTERALNDPLRDNEGMLVDEYGSNAGFHIPNLICTKVLEDEEGSSSEDMSFEAVTPEQDAPVSDDKEESQIPGEKHRHILEEVDGELEMEDVAPPSEAEASTTYQLEQSDTNCTTSEHHPSDSGPPLPDNGPPSSPPLPSSPPPIPPPPPVHIAQSTQLQPTLQMASDPVGPHPPRATYNAQSQQPQSIVEHPRNMNPSVAPLQPPSFCNSGYGAHRNQIAPINPPGSHSSFPTPPAPYHANSYHQHLTESMPNEGYHLQRPPPPPPPNQFPHMPREPHQRPQQWSNNSSSHPESYRYSGHDRDHHRPDSMHHGHDRRDHFNDRGYRHNDRGHHYNGRRHHFDERAVRVLAHHDADRGRFPPFPPVPPIPDHFEASSAPTHYRESSDPPLGPCAGWSVEPPVPHVAGAQGSWKPR